VHAVAANIYMVSEVEWQTYGCSHFKVHLRSLSVMCTHTHTHTHTHTTHTHTLLTHTHTI